MQITITARHFELTKAIREHIENACDKLNRYFDHIINVHFILSLENNRNHVEMNMHAAHSNLHSIAEELDMYLAIDTAIDKMETQVKKMKDKVTDHQRKKNLRENSEYVYANLFEMQEKKAPKKMIKTKRIIAEPMQVNDAIDYLADHEDPYFVFRNIETDRINVLIKKNEQHFKLIEP